MKNTVACVHAHISRRRNRLLVRLSCAGRVLWRSYPLDMPEDEAVMLAVKRLFPLPPPGQQIDAEPCIEDCKDTHNEECPHARHKGKKKHEAAKVTEERKNALTHRLPPYQPCEEAHVEQERKEIEVNLTHRPPPPLRVAWWGRIT